MLQTIPHSHLWLTTKSKHLGLAAFAFISIVLMQWAHFVFYYNQATQISLVWSIVDWTAWVAVFSLLMTSQKKLKTNYLVLGLLFICFSGPTQIMLSNTFYHVVLGSDNTFLESFVRSMNKRWLNNLYIGSLLVLGLGYYNHGKKTVFASKKQLSNKPPSTREQNSAFLINPITSTSAICVEDGNKRLDINLNDILAITAYRNYLSVYTENEEKVIRNTLKNVQQLLPEDNFIQVSRSSLVNRDKIDQIEKYSSSSYHVKLHNAQTIKIGRTYLNSQAVQGLRDIRPN